MEKSESDPKGLARFISILGWLPGYPRSDIRFDLVAGLIASAVVIPQAMAYASIWALVGGVILILDAIRIRKAAAEIVQ